MMMIIIIICPLAKTRFVHFGPDIDQYEVVCIECDVAARSSIMRYYYLYYLSLPDSNERRCTYARPERVEFAVVCR